MADVAANEAPLYPAIYRQSKMRSGLLASFILIVSALKLISISHMQFSPPILIFTVAFLVIGGSVLFRASDKEIILHADSIEIRNGKTPRIIFLDQIYSIKRAGFGRLRIYCKSLNGPDAYIPSGIGGDAPWNAWMAHVEGGDKLVKQS